MTHFYRKMLEESEQNHEVTVAATQKARIIGPQGPMPNLTIVKPPDHTPVSDLELARIAREQGKEVELNDDNQIVDKRDLLTAGLNLAAPNTRRLGMRPSNAQASIAGAETVQTHRAVGTAASRKEINERRAKEIRQQMEAEEDRLAREKRMAEEEAVRRIVAKRNNETDVQSARERYLQRKRQRMEEASQESIPS
jgi:coiled-coil domain-containing protein 55